ncbi:unnamed protein product [Bemisia tabaci]|uniref:Uncharacterized protein n=1 Tax=Bemisia tabaci TaxID=7038 RepID=A0A9P0A6F6_BEMTA|nr:unnamed protein product [Bemisia tabaci]
MHLVCLRENCAERNRSSVWRILKFILNLTHNNKHHRPELISVLYGTVLGYKNREKVANKYIQKSLGKEAQQRQIMEATAEVDELTDNRTAQSSEIETDEMTECDSSRPLFRMPPDRSTFSPFKGGQPMIPPPIPPHIMNHFPQSESEIVSSMLLSWYMSGYHTGYWQGYQASKNRSNSGRSRFRKK